MGKVVKVLLFKNTNKNDFSNFIDCFDNSTWYYPGQFCNNYNQVIYSYDLDIREEDLYYKTLDIFNNK